MQITNDKPDFTPVTIRLETPEDVTMLFVAVSCVGHAQVEQQLRAHGLPALSSTEITEARRRTTDKLYDALLPLSGSKFTV